MPLVEAMAADVPVLAYAAGAVPETLGGAGVLFAPKDLEVRRGDARHCSYTIDLSAVRAAASLDRARRQPAA